MGGCSSRFTKAFEPKRQAHPLQQNPDALMREMDGRLLQERELNHLRAENIHLRNERELNCLRAEVRAENIHLRNERELNCLRAEVGHLREHVVRLNRPITDLQPEPEDVEESSEEVVVRFNRYADLTRFTERLQDAAAAKERSIDFDAQPLVCDSRGVAIDKPEELSELDPDRFPITVKCKLQAIRVFSKWPTFASEESSVEESSLVFQKFSSEPIMYGLPGMSQRSVATW